MGSSTCARLYQAHGPRFFVGLDTGPTTQWLKWQEIRLLPKLEFKPATSRSSVKCHTHSTKLPVLYISYDIKKKKKMQYRQSQNKSRSHISSKPTLHGALLTRICCWHTQMKTADNWRMAITIMLHRLWTDATICAFYPTIAQALNTG